MNLEAGHLYLARTALVRAVDAGAQPKTVLAQAVNALRDEGVPLDEIAEALRHWVAIVEATDRQGDS